MMRYTVVWIQSALNDLAQIWLDSSDRESVTRAADEIDRELAEDAPTKGSELSEGLRSVSPAPLKAIFCVREADRIAEVLVVKNT